MESRRIFIGCYLMFLAFFVSCMSSLDLQLAELGGGPKTDTQKDETSDSETSYYDPSEPETEKEEPQEDKKSFDSETENKEPEQDSKICQIHECLCEQYSPENGSGKCMEITLIMSVDSPERDELKERLMYCRNSNFVYGDPSTHVTKIGNDYVDKDGNKIDAKEVSMAYFFYSPWPSKKKTADITKTLIRDENGKFWLKERKKRVKREDVKIAMICGHSKDDHEKKEQSESVGTAIPYGREGQRYPESSPDEEQEFLFYEEQESSSDED